MLLQAYFYIVKLMTVYEALCIPMYFMEVFKPQHIMTLHVLFFFSLRTFSRSEGEIMLLMRLL